MKISIKSMVLVAMFAALTAVGAFIKIPLPLIPFTMQVFFCAMAGIILGSKLGALSQIVYVIIGLTGIPVFANQSASGISYIFQPTFGFLLGLIVCAFVIGYIVEKVEYKPFITYFLAIISGLIVLYLFGIPYFYLIKNVYLKMPISMFKTVSYVAIPFFSADIVKSILVTILCTLIMPILKRLNYAK